ncbi:MAG: GNAT family N-acetyltransferase [Desulfobulbus sp.]|uniref:GNAT family N-acetyltransferase n=1 Tax=uncultured Desulfobulbus sp. TaxID=239745 RepID=UPI001B693568|nr:GNAT family N-acetyltransferase [uncultured Desulfobulbus sp.]MBP7518475.1 GNAT family N-acetyltransferase [Desulfobulbus sp.]
MHIDIRTDSNTVDWRQVAATLKEVGMGHHAPEVHEQAFAASHTTVFAWQGEALIGFGRAISDGICHAALYDVAVRPAFQGQGIGTRIVAAILAGLPPTCTVILFASPGKEPFYRTLGFRRMLTGMARFGDPPTMAARGFTD